MSHCQKAPSAISSYLVAGTEPANDRPETPTVHDDVAHAAGSVGPPSNQAALRHEEKLKKKARRLRSRDEAERTRAFTELLNLL
jgi:hypothetical protein